MFEKTAGSLFSAAKVEIFFKDFSHKRCRYVFGNKTPYRNPLFYKNLIVIKDNYFTFNI